MIIYSVTVTIDQQIETDWTTWMHEVHIPDVMNTGYFLSSHFQKLLEPVPEPGTATFNIQYHCESMNAYESYQEKAAPALQADHTERFRDRFVAFRTILHRTNSY